MTDVALTAAAAALGVAALTVLVLLGGPQLLPLALAGLWTATHVSLSFPAPSPGWAADLTPSAGAAATNVPSPALGRGHTCGGQVGGVPAGGGSAGTPHKPQT